MGVAGALANVCQEVSRQKHRWGEQGLGYVDRVHCHTRPRAEETFEWQS
jgi:hypothetical protein